MYTIIDLCFLCTKKYNNCVLADDRIVSQVEYLLPEITIIKLCIPLRICSVCDGALCAFSKFKQSSVESSRRLEARIKGAQGPPLHTGSPPVVGDSEASGVKPEMMEETTIKEEYVKETPLDTRMHTNRAFLDPFVLLETISAVSNNQLHKETVTQNIQLHTNMNPENIKESEEISIKEELIEETPEDRDFYNNILKEEYVSNSLNDDTDRQREHNTEDESATLNTSEEVWEGSSTDSEEETVEKTHGISSRNIQTDTNKVTFKIKNRDELKKKIQKRKVHRCNVCIELFVCKALLMRHMKKSHWRIKGLSCTVCKKIFIHQYDLNKHMDLHNGIKNFPCSICNKRFFNNRNLEQHTILHIERKEKKTQARVQIIDSLSYSVSNKKLKYKNIIPQPQHTKTHSGVKQLQCKICDKLFKRKSTLINHMLSHSAKKGFRCEICDKSFTQKSTLTTHMKIHSGVMDYQCEICDKSFTQKSNLTTHLKIHSVVKNYQCKICEKAFTQKSTLTTHMKIHSGVKDYQCEICDKSFTQKSNLTTHMKIHSGVKNYQCKICEKAFISKSNLTTHMKIYSGVKNYQCEICEKAFISKSHLTTHMKIHSGVKNSQCEICDKAFISKSHLTTHMKIHSGVKNYQCEICKKAFISKSHLTTHMKIHSSVKDYQCAICEKSFTQKSHLTTHMKIHGERFNRVLHHHHKH